MIYVQVKKTQWWTLFMDSWSLFHSRVELSNHFQAMKQKYRRWKFLVYFADFDTSPDTNDPVTNAYVSHRNYLIFDWH